MIGSAVIACQIFAGLVDPHPEERRQRRVSKDVATSQAAWFETALTRLLTMRTGKRGYAALFGSLLAGAAFAPPLDTATSAGRSTRSPIV